MNRTIIKVACISIACTASFAQAIRIDKQQIRKWMQTYYEPLSAHNKQNFKSELYEFRDKFSQQISRLRSSSNRSLPLNNFSPGFQMNQINTMSWEDAELQRAKKALGDLAQPLIDAMIGATQKFMSDAFSALRSELRSGSQVSQKVHEKMGQELLKPLEGMLSDWLTFINDVIVEIG